MKTKIKREYRGNGKLLREYCVNEIGQMHGKYKSWYDDGRKCEIGKHMNDVCHGKWTYWHGNGRTDEWYEHGKLTRVIEYRKNGDVVLCYDKFGANWEEILIDCL
jgi:antitoxin component YwqK of YwqJK toxin-antitoxin module